MDGQHPRWYPRTLAPSGDMVRFDQGHGKTIGGGVGLELIPADTRKNARNNQKLPNVAGILK